MKWLGRGSEKRLIYWVFSTPIGAKLLLNLTFQKSQFVAVSMGQIRQKAVLTNFRGCGSLRVSLGEAVKWRIKKYYLFSAKAQKGWYL